MSPDRLRKAQSLAETALALTAEIRDDFLLRETQGDEELLEETKLLIEDEEATRLLTQATQALTDDDETREMGPASPRTKRFDEDFLASRKQIGSYKLLRRIGQGGMGMVYAACLVAEDFQKQVALKLVKPSLASSQILRRFRMERQLLAALDHPNIARLLDAGTSEEGAPYLVMEYVEGLPLDRYCETKSLSISERLKLFLTICDAVQYAHQNLIIHRDIKPSNILVTADGVPKLLDFGIAKLIRPEDEPEAEELKLTATDARPMSPHYASPEQARGEPITTASDIYSLGVLLYELLTGRLPYEFKVRSPAAIEKTICETVPSPPSEVDFKGMGEARDKLRKRLRGDLDMILLMALRKEPQRRYSSVAHFAQDIRAFLDGRPVVAQSDTVGYRVGKFVRRHTAGVAAASLAILALIASTVVSVYFARVANREKIVAQQRFQDTRELARFFVTDFDSKIQAGQTAARRELVAKGLDYLKRLSTEAAGDRELAREVLTGYRKMGDVQGNPFSPNLGDREGARRSYSEALRLAEDYAKRGKTADFAWDIAMAKVKLADLSVAGGNYREALKIYREALPAFEGRERAEVLNKLGFADLESGDYRQALARYGEAADLVRALNDEESRAIHAQAALFTGQTLSRIGETAEALRNLNEAVKLYESLLTKDRGNTVRRRALFTAYLFTGDILNAGQRLGEAEPQYRSALAVAEGLANLDPDNIQYRRDKISALQRLGDLLAATPAKRAEARAIMAQNLDYLRPIVERPDCGTPELQNYLWTLLTTPFADLKRPQEALGYALKLLERTGTGEPSILDTVARAQFDVGNIEEAIRLESKAISLLPSDFRDSALRREFETNLKRFQAARLRTPAK
ncbi:MAG: protein kinase [Bryobacteraceae bacterium]|nr:protein kinase [Bryobacteraceae bacterium]